MGTPGDEDDDDFELELEPVDPEILARERERGKEKTEKAFGEVKVEELFEDRSTDGYDVDWGQLRQFRFTTRHMLMVTAVLAFGLALRTWVGGCMALFVMGCLGVGVGWFVVTRQERRDRAELDRKRREFLAQRATATAAAEVSPWTEDDDVAAATVGPGPREFRFAFSLKEVLIAMTVAAVVLGLLRAVGPKELTITLGALALAGLAIQSFGWLELPPAIVLGWWMMLLLYLGLGLLTAFFPGVLGIGP